MILPQQPLHLFTPTPKSPTQILFPLYKNHSNDSQGHFLCFLTQLRPTRSEKQSTHILLSLPMYVLIILGRPCFHFRNKMVNLLLLRHQHLLRARPIWRNFRSQSLRSSLEEES
uniref:Uncharacterized protein n=1 Tax=Opuntia streptacantha TaxID=393608 RepID=A0A7C9D0B2_OPUST